MSEHDDVVNILSDPKWERGNVVYEWPEDEAEAYRELGWAEGWAAATKVRIDKIAAEVLASDWLAKHDAEVAARALEEFARTITIRSPYGHEVTESMARIQVNNQAWDRAAEYRNTDTKDAH